MTKEILDPAGIARPAYPYYANGIAAEGTKTIFVAGQVAWDADGRVVGVGDVVTQARQALENMRGVLEAAGATMADVAKVTVFVTDMGSAAQIADVRNEYFAGSPPASSIIEVRALLQPELLVEIEGIAVV